MYELFETKHSAPGSPTLAASDTGYCDSSAQYSSRASVPSVGGRSLRL